MDFSRRENETDEELITRVADMKELIGTWLDVTNLLNELLDKQLSDRSYRRIYQKEKSKRCAEELDKTDCDNYLPEMQMQKLELEKERIRLRDERTELARHIRAEARRDSFRSLLEDTVKAYVPQGLEFANSGPEIYNCNTTDLVVSINDLHNGAEVDNCFNKFNTEILRERLNNYLQKVIEIQRRHDCEKCYVVLGGDLIDGIIHPVLRMENNKNVIEQTLDVAEMISEFIFELSKVFSKINVYSVCGNHGRVNANKEENIDGENFEMFAHYFIRHKLSLVTNVEFFENDIDETLGTFIVRGQLVCYAHGDRDDPKNVVANLTQMLGRKPALVLLSHRHRNALSTHYDAKVVESGAGCGTTKYALSKRLVNRPEQAAAVFGDDGLECMYDIKLDKR